MALPASGPITMGQVNTELTRAANALITLDLPAVRTLGGFGGGGTLISMSGLHGKSAQVTTNATPIFGNNTVFTAGFVTLHSDGRISVSGSQTNSGPTSYYTPTTAGIGGSFEAQFTVDSFTAYTGGRVQAGPYQLQSAGTTPWFSLNLDQSLYSSNTSGFTATLRIRNKFTFAMITHQTVTIYNDE